MSGLLALLDDVAALARLAATQVDDIAIYSAKAGSKTAGVVIDDAAVTPKYVHGLPAARELPIVWKIARASVFNKLVILLPVALLLSVFAAWVITPLLMLGGAYLCFEGAEKIWHLMHGHDQAAKKPETLDAAHLERERVAGAIKTDFILSAEIMTIALASIDAPDLLTRGIVLAIVAVVITAVVYGTVALLVKADDIGLRMSQTGRLSATRSLGHMMVKSMPTVLNIISTIGTAAMLWVGGSIIVHGLKNLGFPEIYDAIHDLAVALTGGSGFGEWLVTATADGLLGLLIGLILIPVVTYVILPVASVFTIPKSQDNKA
jgi:predicted DNA repair protein MutK